MHEVRNNFEIMKDFLLTRVPGQLKFGTYEAPGVPSISCNNTVEELLRRRPVAVVQVPISDSIIDCIERQLAFDIVGTGGRRGQEFLFGELALIETKQPEIEQKMGLSILQIWANVLQDVHSLFRFPRALERYVKPV
jgi:hypothetical protein